VANQQNANEDYQYVEVTLLGLEKPLTLIWMWRMRGRLDHFRGEWIPFVRPGTAKNVIYVRREAIAAFEYRGAPYGGRKP
jgi:hypothetical protein